MMGAEDPLLRPVLRGALPYAALHDGSVDLQGVALLNESLDCEAENQRRAHEAARARGPGR
jgi:hypothetical protein